MDPKERGRRSSVGARRSSIDDEGVYPLDIANVTERQARQAHQAQRSSSIQGGSTSRSTR